MTDVRAGLSPGTVLGGYRVESFVARGGMGVVYRATQLALDRIVALKVVAPEFADDAGFRERFGREARLAASLDHPNILPIYEAGEVDGQLFLSMRFVEGTDLKSLIEGPALAPPRAAALVAQVANALDAAHSRGLIHRDVKPGNILIAQEYGQERAYLADFGLSKNLAAGTRLTRTGFMVGTLDYVAPEQVQGGNVDGRVDTYALACVLFEAVTKQIPFERPDDAAKVWAHMSEPPPSAAALAPGISRELDAVIHRGMAKRPEDRFAETGDFGRAAVAAAGPDVRWAPTLVDAPIIEPDRAARCRRDAASEREPPPASPRRARDPDARDPDARDPDARDPAARDPDAAAREPAVRPRRRAAGARPPPRRRQRAASGGRRMAAWAGGAAARHRRRCRRRHRARKQRLRWFVDHHDDDHIVDHDPDDDLLDDDDLAGAGADGGLSRTRLADRVPDQGRVPSVPQRPRLRQGELQRDVAEGRGGTAGDRRQPRLALATVAGARRPRDAGQRSAVDGAVLPVTGTRQPEP